MNTLNFVGKGASDSYGATIDNVVIHEVFDYDLPPPPPPPVA